MGGDVYCMDGFSDCSLMEVEVNVLESNAGVQEYVSFLIS